MHECCGLAGASSDTWVVHMHSLYASSDKSVLPLSELARRIAESYRTPLSEGVCDARAYGVHGTTAPTHATRCTAEAAEHVLCMATSVPAWCKVTKVANRTFVKIEHSVPPAAVREAISAAAAAAAPQTLAT